MMLEAVLVMAINCVMRVTRGVLGVAGMAVLVSLLGDLVMVHDQPVKYENQDHF